jgi:hypothetical protein
MKVITRTVGCRVFLLILLANLVGCSVSPERLNGLPTVDSFSEQQLVEDGLSIAKIELTTGQFPNMKRVVLDEDLYTTWKAALATLTNSDETKTMRNWGLINFDMKDVSIRSVNDKNKDTAQITIRSAEYSPDDAIEGPTGRTFSQKNPVIYRRANIVIHFHENDKSQTIVTILNYMNYQVRSGNGSLIFPTHWEEYQAISKGNIEEKIISNIKNATESNGSKGSGN